MKNKYTRQHRKEFRDNIKRLIQEIPFGNYCYSTCKYIRFRKVTNYHISEPNIPIRTHERYCKLDKRNSLNDPTFWDGLKNCWINESCYLCGKVEHYFKRCDCEVEENE